MELALLFTVHVIAGAGGVGLIFQIAHAFLFFFSWFNTASQRQPLVVHKTRKSPFAAVG